MILNVLANLIKRLHFLSVGFGMNYPRVSGRGGGSRAELLVSVSPSSESQEMLLLFHSQHNPACSDLHTKQEAR